MIRKIAVIIRGYDEGGAVASCCRNQMLAIADEYEVFLLTDQGSSQQPDPHLEEKITIVRFWSPSLRWLFRLSHVPRQILFSVNAFFVLLARHRQQRFNLVLLHSHPTTALLALPLKRLGLRTAMVMHGDIFDRPKGTYDNRLTYWYKLTTPQAYKTCTGVLALSPYMVELALRGGTPRHRIHLSPNGVDPEEIGLAIDDHSDPPSNPSLLFVGRIEYNKGVDLLLEAFCLLSRQWPTLELHCIGNPTPKFQQTLIESLHESGVSVLMGQDEEPVASAPMVRFSPAMARDQLGTHYQKSSLIVVPSRSETQSTVAMEAMAAGRAVVASHTGGNTMLIDSGYNGMLFRNGDMQSLAENLAQLLEDPERIRRMGQNARRWHREHFSRAKAANKLLDGLSAVLDSRL